MRVIVIWLYFYRLFDVLSIDWIFQSWLYCWMEIVIVISSTRGDRGRKYKANTFFVR